MKRKILFVLIPLIGVLLQEPIFAQQTAIDSLEGVLKHEELTPKTRILAMSHLADLLPLTQKEKAMEINQEAIALAQKTNYTDGLTLAWSQQVYLNTIRHKKDEAKQALDSMLYHASESSDFYRGIAYYRQGYWQNLQNEPEEAIISWQKAIPLLTGTASNKYKASLYNLKFGIYSERENLSEATKYAELSLKYAQKSGDIDSQIAAWQIKGTNDIDRFQREKDSLVLDSARQAFDRSIALYKKHQKTIRNPSSVALSALYLANFYLEYYPSSYRDTISKQVDLALNTSRQVGNLAMQANAYDILHKLLLDSGNLEGAEEALLQQKSLADSLPAPNHYLAMNVYQSLASLHEKKGDAAKALDFYKKYIDSYQKVFDAEQTEIIQELEAQYESERKNKKLQLLRQKNKFQKQRTYLYLGIAFTAIIGLLFRFLAYRFKLNYSLQREKLKDEEAARLKAEQALMEQEKEQLQKELMAGMLQIKRHTDSLEELSNKIKETSGNQSEHQLEKFIKDELKISKDFEQIRSEIQDINPDFFTNIQKKTTQKLTASDLKYCTYFSLQLSTKQIAGLLNVTPKSVRMAKYRLKQKFNLGKEDDFDQFLQSFS